MTRGATIQPDHDEDIQYFLHWLEEKRVLRTCSLGCTDYFIPKSVVREYFEDPYKVRKLLAPFYPDGLQPDLVGRLYFKAFSILLCIGKGHFIQHFAQHSDLHHKRIPFFSRPRSFPIDTRDEDFFAKFYKTQWQFCPPTFHDKMEMHYSDDEILPIVKEQKVGQGGSASVYRIVLHKAYDRLDVKSNVSTVITIF